MTLTILTLLAELTTPRDLSTLRASTVSRFSILSFQVQEMIAMRLTNQSLDQLQTIFGDEFVREHHSEPTDRYLPQSGVYGVIRSLVESVRNGVLKVLARLAASRGRNCFPH